MTEQIATTLIIAFFASLPPTIAAVASLVIATRNGAKSDRIIATTGEIHTATNGALAKMRLDLEMAQGQINQLQSMLTDAGILRPSKDKNG